MNTFSDSLLITTTPPEILVGLAIFLCIAALLLFALAIEQGHYPQLKGRILLLGRKVSWARRRQQRWFFVPNTYYTNPEGNYHDQSL